MDILRYERKRQSHKPTRAQYEKDRVYVEETESGEDVEVHNTPKKKNIFKRSWDSIRSRKSNTPKKKNIFKRSWDSIRSRKSNTP